MSVKHAVDPRGLRHALDDVRWTIWLGAHRAQRGLPAIRAVSTWVAALFSANAPRIARLYDSGV